MGTGLSVDDFLDELEFKRDARSYSVNEDTVEAYEYNLMLKGDMIGMYDDDDMNRVAGKIEEEGREKGVEYMTPEERREMDSLTAL